MSSARVVSKFVSRSAERGSASEAIDRLVIYHLAAEREQSSIRDEVKEEHLILVQQSADPEDRVLIFAVRADVYTKNANCVFVHLSKVDSSGFYAKPHIRRPGATLVQNVIAGLVYSIYTRHNGGLLFVNVCSRHNPEYLFTNSKNNDRKHIMKNSRLITWWAKTLDRVSEVLPVYSKEDVLKNLYVPCEEPSSVHRYVPRGSGWKWGCSPLYDPKKPARDLLPLFEDDPKTKVMRMKKGIRIPLLYEHLAVVDTCFFNEIGFLSVSVEIGPGVQRNNAVPGTGALERGKFYFPGALDEVLAMLARSNFSTAEGALTCTGEIANLIESSTDTTNMPKGVVDYEVVFRETHCSSTMSTCSSKRCSQ